MALPMEDPEARTLLRTCETEAETSDDHPAGRRRAAARLALGAVGLLLLGGVALAGRRGLVPAPVVASEAAAPSKAVALFNDDRSLFGDLAIGPFSFPVTGPVDLCNKCKRPLPAIVPSDSGSQCQFGIFKNRVTIVSINLIMSKWNIHKLDKDPKNADYVPCDAIINYGQADEMYFKGAECRYKGNIGSFMGCLNRDGSSAQGGESCRMMSRKVKLSDATTVINGKEVKAKKILGVKKLNLHGGQHDDSLSREYLSYKILRDHLGVTAPCAEPANLFINGHYQGISIMVEQIEDIFTENRFKNDPNDPLKGKGTLWKEMWPECSLPSFYKFAKPIPDFADREMVEEGKDGPHYDLFANLHRESLACMKTGPLCTPLRAQRILNKYVHADSFLDAFLGMVLVANSDQIFVLFHNFFFYVMDSKFYYLPWDFNEVMYDVTGSPLPGYAIPYPWYQRLTEAQRKQVCPYNVPSNSSDINQRRFAHLNCDPVGFVMGVAWKRQFEDKLRKINHPGLVAAVKKESVMYNARIASSVACGAENNGWPPSIKEQQDATCPIISVFDKTIGFYKAVADCALDRWPTPTFADFPAQVSKCMFDGFQAAQYLGQAGLQLTLSVQDCPHTPNGISACTADISNVIASFGYVATFVSSVLSECPITDSAGFAQRGIGQLYDTAPQVECAAMASRIVAGLASVSAGAASASEMCLPGKASANRGLERRLESTGFVQNREMEKATCAFDVLGATFWLALAALAIQEATKTCTSWFGNGAICSRSIFGVLEAVSYVGMFLADSVAQCAEEAQFPMDKIWEMSCAADIQQIIGGMSSLGEGGSGVHLSCGANGRKAFTRSKPNWRFLTPEQYVQELQASQGALADLVRGNTDKLSAWVGKHGNFNESPLENLG